jgi:serine/threonine-protein kinase RsbW
MPAEIQVNADLSNLATVRDFVADAGARICDDPGFVYDLCLAVDEALTNIIQHGYRGRAGQIEICIQTEDGAIAIYIRDRAPEFDPTELPAPDISLPLGERKPGGLGVFLMRSNVDRVEYRRSEDGANELKLVKKIGRE